MSVASKFDERLLSLAWSLWAELGILGWDRRLHQDSAIDPEPLVVFTSAILDLDSRLRDEVMGWCIAYDRLLSAVRLKKVVRQQSRLDASHFHRFAAALNAVSELDWPAGDSVDPMPGNPRIREWSPEFTKSPSSIALRLRGGFGVSARAEVLKVFLAYPDAAFSAPELALSVLYVRRNIALALEALEIGGVVESLRERSSLRYLLARRAALFEIAGPLPKKFPSWLELFRLLLDLRVILASPKQTPLLRAIQMKEFLEAHAFVIARNGLPVAPVIEAGHEAFSQFEEWALQCAALIATNEGDILDTPKLRPTFVRLRRSRPQGSQKRGAGSRRRSKAVPVARA